MQDWQQYLFDGKKQNTIPIEMEAGMGTDLHTMRNANRFLVLNYIRSKQTLLRSELAPVTGLSRTTIGTIIDELLQVGIIQQDVLQKGADRRTSKLIFNAAAGTVLGGTVGRSHVTLLLADLAGTPLFQHTQPLASEEGSEKGLLVLEESIRVFVSQHTAWEKLVGIGLGIVGSLDLSLKKTTVPTPFEGWAGVDIQNTLEQSLGIPVYLDNDGNMGALGESRYGFGQQERNMMYVKVGSGIAGGLILNKQLYRGEQGLAGEIGHIPVELHGMLCHCGQYGCLETIAGKSGILLEVRRINPAIMTITDVITAARDGNPACAHVLERAGTYLGLALASLINCLNPAVIVMDGSTMQAGDLILQPLRTTLREHCLPATLAATRLVIAEQNGLAMARGGVATVLDRVFGQ